MTKACISFAGASGLRGFPEFPPAAAQQLQTEFSSAWEHAVALFKTNLAKFLRSEPLDKIVDKRSGY